MKKINFFKSIQFKIIASVLLTILFFGGIATVGVFYLNRNHLLDLRKEALLNATINRSNQISQLFNFAINITHNIGNLPETRNLIENWSEDNQDNQTEINTYRNNLEKLNINQMFSAIYVMDQDGLTLASTNQMFEGKNYSFREYFTKAINGEDFSDAIVGVTSKELGFYFSHTVFNSQNEAIGVVVGKLKPSYVKILLTNDLKEGVEVHFVNNDGIVLESNKADYIYKSLSTIEENKLKEIQQSRDFEGIEIKPINYSQVYNKILSNKLPSVFISNEGHDSSQKILTISKIKGFDFLIFEEENAQEIQNSILKVALFVTFLVALSAISATIFIGLLIRFFLRPMKQIQNNILSISNNDFSDFTKQENSEIKSGDELQLFSQAIHDMAKTIYSYQQNLEQQIKDKTENLKQKVTELEKLNKFLVGRELKMTELKKEIKKLKKEKDEKK